jgi:hypothetical protein
LIKKYFTLGGKTLEPVQTFCYLGIDIKASGSVSAAINTLYDTGADAGVVNIVISQGQIILTTK